MDRARTGTSGGTLAPILLVSGAYGSLVGTLAHNAGSSISAGSVALVAMAATFGASTRATFTAIVFAFELTRDYNAILPMMLAAVLADLVASALLDHGLMTEKLARRDLRVPRMYEPDVLAHTSVAEAMTRAVEVLDPAATFAVARERFVAGGHGAYPIAGSDGILAGIVTRADVLDAAAASERVAAIADTDVVTAHPGEVLSTALQRMLDEGVDHLPVVDDSGRLVGILTRTDLLRVQRGRMLAEVPQDAWRPQRRTRRSRGSEPG